MRGIESSSSLLLIRTTDVGFQAADSNPRIHVVVENTLCSARRR